MTFEQRGVEKDGYLRYGWKPRLPEEYVFEPFSDKPPKTVGVNGRYRRKTIEEKEMEEIMKEVDMIAPGWKDGDE